MNVENMPLFWRLQDTENSGLDDVSLLMPSNAGEPAAIFPTDVSFCSRRNDKNIVDVRWSDEDSDLFMSLLDRISEDDEVSQEIDDSLVVDISDNVVQGIVQLVALARFKTPWPSDELVGEDFITEREEIETGDLVSINTLYGYALAIVVGMDSIDVNCILLEDIVDGDVCLVPDHSLMVVNRLSVLPAAFSDIDMGEGMIVH
ncbi:MAG: hypothetical protein P1U57_04920 [Oleibacter sp.]|nr:hypothetical protein [Thalassolituus sp.]